MRTRTIFLLRHGVQDNDILTIEGIVAVHLAAGRFIDVWNGKSVAAWNAPAPRAVESAEIFTRVTSIPSQTHQLLHLEHTFYHLEKHNEFAQIALKTGAENLILIGHDESRRQVEALVRLGFNKNEVKSPRMPQGGLLRYTKEKGYELLTMKTLPP